MKWLAVDSQVRKAFIDSQKFHCVQRRFGRDAQGMIDMRVLECGQCHARREIVYGGRFFAWSCLCGAVRVSSRIRVQQWYYTVWGDYYCGKVFLSNSAKNVSESIGFRLFNAPGGNLERAAELRAAQDRTFLENRIFKRCLHEIKDRLINLPGIRRPWFDTMCEYVQEEHPKRALRINALIEGYLNGDDKKLPDFCRRLECKAKKEVAKYGKALRNVVDLGCFASLFGGYLAKQVKYATSSARSQYWEFIASPELKRLKGAFERLRQPKQLYYLFFSDDSCVAIECADGIFRANMDISGADGSAGPRTFRSFELLCKGTTYYDVARGCVNQCRKELVVKHPHISVKEVYRPREAFLPSGSVLTTTINNIGNLMIYSCLHTILEREFYSRQRMPTMAQCEELCIRAGAEAGYILTVEICRCFEDLQFLKMSPDKDCKPWVNLGVLLRCLHRAEGDLPPRVDGVKVSIESRCANRDKEVVASMVHAGDHVITEALRTRHKPGSATGLSGSWVIDNIVSGVARDIDMQSLCARYRCSGSELMSLVDAILTWEFGTVIDLEVTRRIFKKDYGFEF